MTPKKKPKSDNEIVQIAARITQATYKRLKLLAVQEDKFINDLLIEGIEYILNKYQNAKKS
jgi:hypothetical protein